MREEVTVILTDAAVKNKALEDDQQRSNSQKDRRIETQGAAPEKVGGNQGAEDLTGGGRGALCWSACRL